MCKILILLKQNIEGDHHLSLFPYWSIIHPTDIFWNYYFHPLY
jgi:hypothetical protein